MPSFRKLFPSQLDEETVFLVVREHWFHFFLKVVVWLFFAAILVMFNHYMPQYVPLMFSDRAGQVTHLFTQVYTQFLAVSLFLIFIFYYLTIDVITDIRIVDVIQEGLFNHTVSELHIDKIEDVTSKTAGLFGTIFNYGDVYVQTAGTVERFEFNSVPNPGAIEKMILDLYEKNSNFVKDAQADKQLLSH